MKKIKSEFHDYGKMVTCYIEYDGMNGDFEISKNPDDLPIAYISEWGGLYKSFWTQEGYDALVKFLLTSDLPILGPSKVIITSDYLGGPAYPFCMQTGWARGPLVSNPKSGNKMRFFYLTKLNKYVT